MKGGGTLEQHKHHKEAEEKFDTVTKPSKGLIVEINCFSSGIVLNGGTWRPHSSRRAEGRWAFPTCPVPHISYRPLSLPLTLPPICPSSSRSPFLPPSLTYSTSFRSSIPLFSFSLPPFLLPAHSYVLRCLILCLFMGKIARDVIKLPLNFHYTVEVWNLCIIGKFIRLPKHGGRQLLWKEEWACVTKTCKWKAGWEAAARGDVEDAGTGEERQGVYSCIVFFVICCSPEFTHSWFTCKFPLKAGLISNLQNSVWVVLGQSAMVWKIRSGSGFEFASSITQLRTCP